VSVVSTFKLTLAYEGTDFIGWQRQATGRSVQASVEEALSRLEGGSVTVIGAGRTDAGVHALGQVASVTVTHLIDAGALRRALNAILAPDVRVVAIEAAPPDFNARYAARGKTYRYRIVCGDFISPFDRRFAWHVPHAMDEVRMAAAAERFEGRHDFAAFQSAGSGVTTTVRSVAHSRLSCADGECGARTLTYEVRGDGFLRHMVRAMVGTLVDVGAGRLVPGDVDRITESGDRQRAGPTAPAHGLFLVEVSY